MRPDAANPGRLLLLTRPAPAAVAGRRPVRLRGLSGVWRPRVVAGTLGGAVLLVVVCAVSLGRGEYDVPVLDVLRVLAGGGAGADRFVLLELRLPRILVGALVGAALCLAGAISQAVTRNPLASPDILGVTDGAGAAAVFVLVVAGPAVANAYLGLPAAALAGGLLTAALVYVLAWRNGIEGNRLVLVGIGIGAVASALTSWLLVIADVQDAARASFWLVGSLNARGWEHAVPVGAALVVLLPAALLLTFGLSALQLGDDTATGLGVRVNRVRSALIVLAVALSAIATASAGPVGFLALVVPQICQRLVATPTPPLATSMVLGATALVGADLVGRTMLPIELPVGLVTAVLFAPYLLYLIARRRRGADR